MTDNRTTELLPCPFCGGEADEYEGDYGNGIYCMRCGAMVGEPIHLEYMTTKRVSIAEAIAAWNTRADYHGYEQAAIEAWESIKAWNARATHGTLTAEQVREAAKSTSRKYESPVDDGVWIKEYDWQAIADELNARAERTCHIIEYDEVPYPVCSECGAVQPDDYTVYFCWSCGAKVRDE